MPRAPGFIRLTAAMISSASTRMLITPAISPSSRCVKCNALFPRLTYSSYGEVLSTVVTRAWIRRTACRASSTSGWPIPSNARSPGYRPETIYSFSTAPSSTRSRQLVMGDVASFVALRLGPPGGGAGGLGSERQRSEPQSCRATEIRGTEPQSLSRQ